MYKSRELSKSLTSFSGLDFPRKFPLKKDKRYKAVIGIGGNLGDVKRRFKHLLVTLERDRRVLVEQTSLILKNPPFGYMDQDDFFNSIIVLKVDMQPKQFLAYLLRLEKRFGRKRSFANAPRTLDLDIIFFDQRVINTDKLVIPHPHWYKRESVTIPLAGILV